MNKIKHSRLIMIDKLPISFDSCLVADILLAKDGYLPVVPYCGPGDVEQSRVPPMCCRGEDVLGVAAGGVGTGVELAVRGAPAKFYVISLACVFLIKSAFIFRGNQWFVAY